MTLIDKKIITELKLFIEFIPDNELAFTYPHKQLITYSFVYTLRDHVINNTTKQIKIHLLHLFSSQATNDKPTLFVISGMSHNSYLGVANVIFEQLNELLNVFSNIYLIEYDDFKKFQAHVFSDATDKINKGETDYNIIYDEPLKLNLEIIEFINYIAKDLGLNNIHVLGKCNGAWIAAYLITYNIIYKGLYLAVPGIPFGLKILDSLPNDRFLEINFAFGWVKQDAYKYHWQIISYDEKNRYDKDMNDIIEKKQIKKTFISNMYNFNTPEHEKNNHKLHPDLVTDIIKSLI